MDEIRMQPSRDLARAAIYKGYRVKSLRLRSKRDSQASAKSSRRGRFSDVFSSAHRCRRLNRPADARKRQAHCENALNTDPSEQHGGNGPHTAMNLNLRCTA